MPDFWLTVGKLFILFQRLLQLMREEGRGKNDGGRSQKLILFIWEDAVSEP